MQSAETNGVTNECLNISDVGQKFRSKVAAATIRGAMTVAVLSALLLMAARPAQAQTESVLYNFTDSPDGANPESRLTFHGGNLYGTTYSGGLGSGTVFELSPNGSGGWTEAVLYNFCSALPSCADGSNPTYSHVIFDSLGNLYGTAYAGGANGYGVVFELSPAGETWTETVLYNFANSPDGANPVNGLIADAVGNLYGTTYGGGTTGNGTVFEMSPSGGGWTEKVIFNVNSTYSGLTMDTHGNIFGTTYRSVYELAPNGKGGWRPTTIFTFTSANGPEDGSNPNGTPAVDGAGNIYGTTYGGGKNGNGTVYKLNSGVSGWTLQILYVFGNKGAHALGGVVLDSAGNVYGTTSEGGKYTDGVVFELAPNGTGGYTYQILHNFDGEDGNDPYDSLIMDSAGYLYGTTYLGGSSGDGAVFEVNPKATLPTVTIRATPSQSTEGEAVTFTATITSSVGPPPDGEMITFEPIGEAPLVGGKASYTTSALPVGKTNVRAVYWGDLNFLESKSLYRGYIVNP